jgi:hypothetical protein
MGDLGRSDGGINVGEDTILAGERFVSGGWRLEVGYWVLDIGYWPLLAQLCDHPFHDVVDALFVNL